ncbi:hypothetical protein PHAVU_006G081600 [Phaseolus vulgaris]|uniref:Uncharacterized protein n=1 Tax=Phaseolus vulgaris TaxID=3885 RepID=V7BQQ9_PHAVU|nr:hypothetical protein PHAVU_006G081600g [Phaseolus vulgaris]ESW18911.1 hypothetical protein PHAVU_006G081600g [Phaseolus vulgaris]
MDSLQEFYIYLNYLSQCILYNANPLLLSSHISSLQWWSNVNLNVSVVSEVKGCSHECMHAYNNFDGETILSCSNASGVCRETHPGRQAP